MVGGESVRERNSVAAANHGAITVLGHGTIPEARFDASKDVLRRIVGRQRRKEVRGRGDAKPVAAKHPAGTDVERPAIGILLVEARLVKCDGRTDIRAAHRARPVCAHGKRVHRHGAPRRLGTVHRLRGVAQSHAAVDQAEVPYPPGGNPNRADHTGGVDGRGRLNGLEGELQPGAVLGLRGIPDGGGGPQCEGGGSRERRGRDPPQRCAGRLLCAGARRAERRQANQQYSNALHAERLLKAVAPSTQVNYLQPVTALGHTPLRLSELLTPDRIRVPLRAQNKDGVLRELVELLVGGNGAAPDVLQAVLERERQFPTGIGYGVAVPHGKTPALANLIAVAGTAPTPVPYETVDGEPVRLFFLLAGPESQAGAHVKALSRISRLVRREPIRARLLAANDATEFYRILCDAEMGGA